VVTQLLVGLTCWIKRKKKIAINLVSSKTKANNCYSRPILDILFRKWFPLSKVPSPRTITHEELISLANQECQVAQQRQVSFERVIKE
jgi:hypothetical protein